jgi:hypothetical protein
LEIDKAEFYSPSLSASPAQGDIVLNVPFLSFPDVDLPLIRGQDGETLAEEPQGTVRVIPESGATEPFKNGSEFVMVKLERGAVAIMTPTCDLSDADLWQIAPVLEFNASEDKRKGLVFGGHLQDKFPVVAHPEGYYADAYIDLADLRTLPRDFVKGGTRVAALNSDYQRELAEFAAKLFGRFWGMNPDEGDVVPEDGLYRCIRDSYHHDVRPGEISPISLRKGDLFPRCANCDRIHKGAQFILLSKHRRY